MTLRKWFHLIWTTLLIGIGLELIAGLSLKLTDREYSIFGLSAFGLNLAYIILIGAVISLLSQMGYFAFLIVRYIGMGIIRNQRTMDLLQWALVIVTLFELIFLRYISFGGGWLQYVPLAVAILIAAWVTAYWKVKLTNDKGFLPTLFFMIVVTVLEAIPALRENNAYGTYFMLVPLIGCNAWQILILPRVLQPKKSEP